jgi:Flp pilus assembly protein TadG
MKMTRKFAERRSAVVTVEAAIVLPILLFFLIAILAGSLMVYIKDEVSNVSREGARYASVRGANYALTTKNPAATAADITAYVKKSNAMLDPNSVTCTVTWDTSNRVGQFVTVEVKYQWKGFLFFKAAEFTSKSTAMITY